MSRQFWPENFSPPRPPRPTFPKIKTYLLYLQHSCKKSKEIAKCSKTNFRICFCLGLYKRKHLARKVLVLSCIRGKGGLDNHFFLANFIFSKWEMNSSNSQLFMVVKTCWFFLLSGFSIQSGSLCNILKETHTLPASPIFSFKGYPLPPPLNKSFLVFVNWGFLVTRNLTLLSVCSFNCSSKTFAAVSKTEQKHI